MEKVTFLSTINKTALKGNDEILVEEEEATSEDSALIAKSISWKTLHHTIQEINKYVKIGKDEKVMY